MLFQFPQYIYPSRRWFGYLEWVAGELPGLRVAVEFRQRRWMDDEHRAGTLDFLRRHGLAYVCVEEPHGLWHAFWQVVGDAQDVAVGEHGG